MEDNTIKLITIGNKVYELHDIQSREENNSQQKTIDEHTEQINTLTDTATKMVEASNETKTKVDQIFVSVEGVKNDVDELDSKVGDLTTLTTDVKTDVVSAVNEVKTETSGLSDKLTDMATKSELTVEKERIDNLSEVVEERATAVTELQDIRVGADGTTYDSAGEAIRTQFTNMQMNHSADIDALKSDISQLSEDVEGIKQNIGGSGSIMNPTVEPSDNDIPKVFIDGEIPTSKTEVLATMEYISKTDYLHAYLKIKCQGNSSMSYPKKNFTISMYSDEARTVKLKKLFKDWNIVSNKYVLKANWIDHSHARNIVSANLWTETIKSRSDYDSLPNELKTSPRNGAIDGFPVKLYTNGIYQGIYTLNIGKDAFMWNMDKDNPNHILLCAETNTDGTYAENACNFRALWNGTDGNNWSIEVGTNSTEVKDSLNRLIACVKDTDDETFKNTISAYLDVQSAIDYYVHQYVICGLDGLAKNMLLGTYDLTKWHCGAYDMDSTFGLWWNGSKYVSAEYRCPEDYQEQFSLLWERIETVFLNELKGRYFELRKTVYSYSNMITKFERFMDRIGLGLYSEDLTIYSGIPSGSTNNIKQIRDYIRDRLVYCDVEFTNMAEKVDIPATGITLDQTTLSFIDKTPVTLIATVEPADTTDTITWESSNTTVATVADGVVTAVANGDCVITATCGEHSASCSVTVEGIGSEASSLIYSLQEATTFDGSNYIDTGIQLFAEDIPFTVMVDWEHTGESEFIQDTHVVAHCMNEASPYPGIVIQYNTGSLGLLSEIRQSNNLTIFSKKNDSILNENLSNMRVVLRKDSSGMLTISRRYNHSGSVLTTSLQGTYITITQNLLLGCYQTTNGTKGRYAKGIMNDCKVYNCALSDEEIDTWLYA